MYLEEQLNIETPENVRFAYEIAGIGSRFMAALVDTTLILLLQLTVFVPLLLFTNLLDESGWSVLLGVAVFISFVLLWGYYIFFEALWNGQTPGKRWVGLRVVQLSGLPMTFSEVIIRNLVRVVDFLPGAYGLGVITMFFQAQSRRLGDLAAGTLVVFDRTALTLAELGQTTAVSSSSPATLDPQTLTFPEITHWPLERLPEPDLATIESYLRRAPGLHRHRAQIAQQLLDLLYTRLPDIEPLRPITLDEQETLLRELLLIARRR